MCDPEEEARRNWNRGREGGRWCRPGPGTGGGERSHPSPPGRFGPCGLGYG
ncbi:hypothetical protein AvCA_15430 [Azotobacter vinelandii CA]|uniref:Uncharacterized protein n=2 Tax=Azotobacter vinelandii TaxID=354 RepID=C1DRM0_AZOVD|nr:hypothetical protein Avin_15430 [Azotobacter vinelandii DJ]AGK15290.1 hypothetical protein AvCA_15430 [Azotobacter vinelandii CA]AGK19962.1 hypothetical protein AvCA6_15430 [Azotobacter vinelandii CA6]